MIAAGLFLLAAAAGGSPSSGCVSAAPCPSAGGVAEIISRGWLLNCSVDGATRVRLRARIVLDGKGWLVREPEIIDEATGQVIDLRKGNYDSQDVTIGAAVRARTAVLAAQPYANLPPELVGRSLVIRFNADKACG